MLAIIQVGDNDASNRYIRNKMKAIREAGLEVELVKLREDISTMALASLIRNANENPEVTAIMVQLPLPPHIDKNYILSLIDPRKDIDGLNPYSGYRPLTPCAIMRWIENEVKMNLAGWNVVILGRSELVGKPLANMMIDAGATVTVCNSKSGIYFVKDRITEADVVVSATGTILDDDYFIYCDALVIDVGINRDENRKLCGDISAMARKRILAYGGVVTPVPGGVGKWTVEELVLRLKEMEEEK